MSIPDFMVGPDGGAPPEITDAAVLAAIFSEPVLIVLPRFAVSHVRADGALVAADAFEAAVRHFGARPLTDLAFDADPVPGWSTAVDMAAGGARVAGPEPLGVIYDGGLDANAEWHQRVAAARGRGLVVITGSAVPVPDAVMEMMEAGRASWVRTALAPARWRRA